MTTSFLTISRFDQILKDLRDRIRRADFPMDRRLPSERDLAEQYHCSQPTINKVIATLVMEQILERRESRGSYVAKEYKTKQQKLQPIKFMGWLGAETIGSNVWDAVYASFKHRYPNLETLSIDVPYEQFPQRLTQMIGQGQAPDVVQIVNNWTGHFASLGALIPLDAKIPDAVVNDHLTWRKHPNQYRGATYSIDWALSSTLLFCNHRIMREAGLDPNRPPRTMDELQAMVTQIGTRKLMRDKKPVYGFATPTGTGEVTATYWLSFLFASGGRLIDENGRVALAAPEAVRALEFFVSLITASRLPSGMSIWDQRKLFAQDRVGFILDGSMGRGFFRKESGLGVAYDAHFSAGPIPAGVTGHSETVAHHHSLAVMCQTPHEKESFAFVEHMLSDRTLALRYYEEEGLIPARKSLLSLPEYREPYARLVLEQAKRAHVLPTEHPNLQIAMVFLGNAIHRVLNKEMDAASSLSEVARNIELLL